MGLKSLDLLLSQSRKPRPLFLVVGERGEYEDYTTWVSAGFLDGAQAELYLVLQSLRSEILTHAQCEGTIAVEDRAEELAAEHGIQLAWSSGTKWHVEEVLLFP